MTTCIAPETELHAFTPYTALAAQLLPHAIDTAAGSGDGAHDAAHLQRVWRSVQALQAVEGGDLEALLAATLLHDCVNVEKNSPLRAQASRLSAQKAAGVLTGLGWPQARIEVAALRQQRLRDFYAAFLQELEQG